MFARLDYTPVSVDFNAWLKDKGYEPLPFEVRLIALETDWCDEPEKASWEYVTRSCAIVPDGDSLSNLNHLASRLDGMNKCEGAVWLNRMNFALAEAIKWNARQI